MGFIKSFLGFSVLYYLLSYFHLSGSKEPERKDAIIEEATQKRIKVNFVLTGYCGENQMVDQALYHEIADATAGFVSIFHCFLVQ